VASILPFIRKAGAVFDYHATRLMGDANAACKDLHDKRQPNVVYEVIAKRIIDSFKDGERDTDRLRKAGLMGLGTRDDKAG
jgi:hypothetical protein